SPTRSTTSGSSSSAIRMGTGGRCSRYRTAGSPAPGSSCPAPGAAAKLSSGPGGALLLLAQGDRLLAWAGLGLRDLRLLRGAGPALDLLLVDLPAEQLLRRPARLLRRQVGGPGDDLARFDAPEPAEAAIDRDAVLRPAPLAAE